MYPIFIISILLFAGITFVSNRKQYISPIILCGILTYIFAFNTDNSDFLPYMTFYNNSSWQNIGYPYPSSPLFSISMLIAKSFGLNFEFYRMLLFVILLLTIHLTVREYTCESVLLLAYVAFPYILDAVQIRYAWSSLFIIIGLLELFQGSKKKALIFIVIASLFHTMNSIFVIFVFLPSLNEHILTPKTIKITTCIFSLMLLFGVARAPILSLITYVIKKIPLFGEYSRYLKITVHNGYILLLIYQIANIFTAYKNYMLLNRDYLQTNSCAPKLMISNLNFQYLGLFFVVFSMMNINFSRYFRIFYMMNAIAFSASFLYMKSIARKRNSFNKLLIFTKPHLNLILLFLFWILVFILGENFVNGAIPNNIERIFNSLKII